MGGPGSRRARAHSSTCRIPSARRCASPTRRPPPSPGPGARGGKAPDRPTAALRKPGAPPAAGPGLLGEKTLGIAPVRAPAGVEQDRVSGRGVDAIEIIALDHVSRLRRIDEPSGCDDLRHGLDTEP